MSALELAEKQAGTEVFSFELIAGVNSLITREMKKGDGCSYDQAAELVALQLNVTKEQVLEIAGRDADTKIDSFMPVLQGKAKTAANYFADLQLPVTTDLKLPDPADASAPRELIHTDVIQGVRLLFVQTRDREIAAHRCATNAHIASLVSTRLQMDTESLSLPLDGAQILAILQSHDAAIVERTIPDIVAKIESTLRKIPGCLYTVASLA
jgi:hypothetical protein